MSPGFTVVADILILNSVRSTETVVGSSVELDVVESDFVIATIATTPSTTVDIAIAASIIAVIPRVHVDSLCDELTFCSGNCSAFTFLPFLVV